MIFIRDKWVNQFGLSIRRSFACVERHEEVEGEGEEEGHRGEAEARQVKVVPAIADGGGTESQAEGRIGRQDVGGQFAAGTTEEEEAPQSSDEPEKLGQCRAAGVMGGPQEEAEQVDHKQRRCGEQAG